VYFYVKQRRFRNVFSYLVFPLIGLAVVGFVWSGFDRITFVFGGSWLLMGLVGGAFKSRSLGVLDVASQAPESLLD
jgi:hypothetical protein